MNSTETSQGNDQGKTIQHNYSEEGTITGKPDFEEQDLAKKFENLNSDELKDIFKTCGNEEAVAIIAELQSRANQMIARSGPYYKKFIKENKGVVRKSTVEPFVRSTSTTSSITTEPSRIDLGRFRSPWTAFGVIK